MDNYKLKCDRLHELMRRYTARDVAVAFSGGVDSGLLLKLACEHAGENGHAARTVYAITMQTCLHPGSEIEDTRRAALEAGAIHLVLTADEIMNAGIADNPPERCYLCKKYLFQRMLKKAGELKTDTLLEGTNEDDLHAYRPGIQALGELGIHSPLAEAGLTKQEVRRLAAEYRVPAAEKPSMPCLATRFPYGTHLTYENMHKVELGEAFLKSTGAYNVRLRIHGDIARIEVDGADMEKILGRRQEITAYLKSLGYSYIAMDLEGFRSGSMDLGLKK